MRFNKLFWETNIFCWNSKFFVIFISLHFGGNVQLQSLFLSLIQLRMSIKECMYIIVRVIIRGDHYSPHSDTVLRWDEDADKRCMYMKTESERRKIVAKPQVQSECTYVEVCEVDTGREKETR